MFDKSDLLSRPQEAFHYSGFDNVLLSAVMQDAAGQHFDEVMKSRVFVPLNLTTMMPDHLRPQDMNFARSYQTRGRKVKPWRRVDLSHAVPNMASSDGVAT